jgi:hypothetical protein
MAGTSSAIPATASRRSISESVLSDFNGLRRHFRVIPFLNAEAWSRVAHGKRQPAVSTFRKNNTKPQPVWQEIVDVSYPAFESSSRR